MNKSKLFGQIFTEYFIRRKMIKMYKDTHSLINSKILEPSFGTGNFLIDIIRDAISEGRNKGYSEKKISYLLNNNIYGFEIDGIFYKQCMKNIKTILNEMKFKEKIKFDHLHNQTVFSKMDNNFDLIIGNPPYVRVQNFDNGIHDIKKSLSRTSGNTDLFLMFIDYLLEHLNKKGQFIFIIPNSFGKSHSSKKLREWFFNNGSFDYYDYEDIQVFPNVSVYSAIFYFKNNNINKSFFYSIKEKKKWEIKDWFFFAPKIKSPIKKDLAIKNGVATLLDKVFIIDEKMNVESIYRIYKGSRWNEKKYAVFPYIIKNDEIMRFKSEDHFKKQYPKMYKYLLKYKNKLSKRSLEKNTKWFEYGRSQAIKDIAKPKIIINTLIKPNQKKLFIKEIPKNTLVYSGLYSTNVLLCEINDYNLIEYLRFISKDMRGGYKKISSSLFKIKNEI